MKNPYGEGLRSHSLTEGREGRRCDVISGGSHNVIFKMTWKVSTIEEKRIRQSPPEYLGGMHLELFPKGLRQHYFK